MSGAVSQFQSINLFGLFYFFYLGRVKGGGAFYSYLDGTSCADIRIILLSYFLILWIHYCIINSVIKGLCKDLHNVKVSFLKDWEAEIFNDHWLNPHEMDWSSTIRKSILLKLLNFRARIIYKKIRLHHGKLTLR